MDKCQRCGEDGYDRRTLRMACFYEMGELDIPFEKSEPKDGNRFYTLRVCKDCRADWMQAIKTWFDTKPSKESCGSGIFVRRNGTSVEISQEEWNELNPGREPVRLRS